VCDAVLAGDGVQARVAASPSGCGAQASMWARVSGRELSIAWKLVSEAFLGCVVFVDMVLGGRPAPGVTAPGHILMRAVLPTTT